MEKLEAVNYCMKMLGSPPVGDLESLHPSVTACITEVNTAKRTIQKEGWWFNKEYSHELIPDTNGDINLPLFVLEATVTNQAGVVKRGQKLYDTVNNTYQFNQRLYVNYIVDLDWELLDETVQDTIQYFAAMMICENTLEDSLKANAQAKLYTKSLSDMKKTHLRTQRRNIINSPRSARARGRVRPYASRSSTRNPNIPGG